MSTITRIKFAYECKIKILDIFVMFSGFRICLTITIKTDALEFTYLAIKYCVDSYTENYVCQVFNATQFLTHKNVMHIQLIEYA